ncbi:MAG: ATP-dependent RecD-like DNA helicase [Candidatus Schekmanbacteria bacterium]|nr:ATP-dependent RecD-like DNA helicase [Candidatus Schekmanbacteria bacterium]
MEAENVVVEGGVARIVFTGNDGWTVLRVRTDADQITCVGVVPELREDDRVRLTGTWQHHERFGRQLKIATCQLLLPVTQGGLVKYLSSGRFKGIGTRLAERLVAHFGFELPNILDHQPERLREVKGVGKKMARTVIAAWQEGRAEHELHVTLAGWGISQTFARRILATWGNDAIAKIRANPYELCRIEGIGFIRADAIARELGIGESDPRRAVAAIAHVMEEASASEGHTYLRVENIVHRTDKLGIPEERISETLAALAASGQILVEGDNRYYLPSLHAAECQVAQHVNRIATQELQPISVEHAFELALLEKELGIRFAPEQVAAIEHSLATPMQVITGGPGTGKTTITRAIVELFADAGKRVVLCAPTGRAARRLTEATGRRASTIHRLLELDPESWTFARDERDPLKADLVLVDEASMVDVRLAAALLRAIPDNCRVVWVGDVDQLPPVSPGQVLCDLIHSLRIPVLRLRTIFRQAQESLIVVNAHRLLTGQRMDLRSSPQADFELIAAEDGAAACDVLRALFTEGLRARGFAAAEVQVLAPMRRGTAGIAALNQLVGDLVNPSRPGVDELIIGNRVYRVGDRVMQIRNNYRLEVFNGDIGNVLSVDTEAAEGKPVLHADFGLDEPVPYLLDDLENLVPAWASTIHKAQGSEFPCVVLILLTEHWIMLKRRLAYTGITRGKKRVILVGSPRAIAAAARDRSAMSRQTTLTQRLTGELPCTYEPPYSGPLAQQRPPVASTEPESTACPRASCAEGASRIPPPLARARD